MAVTLKDVVDNMDMQGSDSKAFLNPKTGKFVLVASDFFYILDGEGVHLDIDLDEFSEWEKELVKETLEVRDSGDYVALPDRHQIDEYGIMQDFCTSIEPITLRDDLLNKIHGSGAFRKFKDAISRRGIEEQWYAYRREALEAVAIDWLHAHEIEFTADLEAG